MVFWSKILFQLGFLILTIELSTEEELNSLKYRDTAKIAHALSNVSRALECFGETTAASQRDQSAALHELGNRLQESLQLQRDNSKCSSSVEKLADTVRYLLEKNADLQDHLNTTLEKVAMMESDIKAQKEQLLGKDEKVIAVMLSAGYQHFPGFGFYKFVPQAATWDDAVQNCKANGTQLGIVSSREEAKIYSQILANPPTIVGAVNLDYFHSGFSEIRNTRQFQTLDGVALTESGYSEWDQGEPNNVDEQCGSMIANAKLNDVDCSEKYAYICELEYS